MKNKAKSIEIASKVADGYGIDFEPLAEATLDMADWKDRQFKEYLEKLEDECDKEYKVAIANNDIYEASKAYGRMCIIIEIIDELFGEE